jgi:hypothetical protein
VIPTVSTLMATASLASLCPPGEEGVAVVEAAAEAEEGTDQLPHRRT